MKRRILLVDDEVAVLLTLKAVLEISGFDVDTAASAREGKARIKHREYEMVITDMRMEGERAGEEVINAAKAAPYKPAVALLSAFPVDEDALADMGADKVLVKPMHTRQLLQQLESLFIRHHGATEDPAESTPADAPPKKAEKPVAKPSAAAKSIAPVEDPRPARKTVPKPQAAPAKKPTTSARKTPAKLTGKAVSA